MCRIAMRTAVGGERKSVFTDFVIRQIGITAAAVALMTSAVHAHAQTAAPTPVFLMIGDDHPADSSKARISCADNTHRLARQLKQQGFQVFEVLNPSSVDLRVALRQFSRYLEGAYPVVSYCGYASVQDGRVFLASDGGESELFRRAVPAVSLLRTLDGRDGLVFMEIHRSVGEPQALEKAVQAMKDRVPNADAVSITLADTPAANPVLDGLASVLQPGWQWAAVKAFAQDNKTPGNKVQGVTLAPAAPTAVSVSVSSPDVPHASAAESAVQIPQDIQPATPATAANNDAPAALPDQDEKKTNSVASDSQLGVSQPVNAPSPKPAVRPKPVLTKQQALKLARAKEIQAQQIKTMRTVQVSLLARGVYQGSVNGQRTKETVNAIRKFQQSRNEPATGQLTAAQISALTGVGN